MKNIGNTIKAFREGKKLTKTEMGKLLNVSGQLIGQYERGRQSPKLDFYHRWRSVFGQDLAPIPETNVSPNEERNEVVGLLKLMYETMRTQNRILENEAKSNSENIKLAVGGVSSMALQMSAAREVMLKSLSRIEKKPEDHLLKELDKTTARKMKELGKQDRLAGVGN